MFAFERDHEKTQDCERASRYNTSNIHAGREYRNRDDRSQTDSASFQQRGLSHGSFNAGGEFFGFLIAVVRFDNGGDAFTDGIDQFTTARLARTVAFADQMIEVLRPATLQVTHDLLPFVQVGVTDRISIGAGTPLIFGEGSAHPFWITPKVQVYSGTSGQASVGVMHFLNVGDGNLGIAYVVATKGSLDSAVTGGVGYAYDRTYDNKNGSPVAMIGGEHRISRGVKVMTENYVLNGAGIVTGGVRWMGERFSADFAMVVPIDGDSAIAFPLVNVVYSFSR